MSRNADVPDIVVLPPVVVLGAIVVGLMVHYALWTVTPLPLIPSRVTGFIVFCSSGVLAHSAHNAMKRVGTNVLPTKPTLALATDGPFRHTRNPLYLAAIGVYLGIALWVDSMALLLLLIPVVLLLHFGVVLREERYLEEKFGDAYRGYRVKVRRWV